jgi:putative hydrolase of the HAD superfamily
VVIRAVIFDWFGTLAQWPHGPSSSYATLLEEHGYRVDPDLLNRYHARWDGVDHTEHSTSRDRYMAWTRQRLVGFMAECGVPQSERDVLVDAMVEVDQRTAMVVFPEVPTVLGELRRRGLTIGVCSNWNWDLDVVLESTAVAPLIDAAVTSARVGYRKPHAAMYDSILTALGVKAPEALFVGDSWKPDVLGPIEAGIRTVHVWRGEGTDGLPALVPGASRVDDLRRLLDEGFLDDGFLDDGYPEDGTGEDGYLKK